MNKKTFLNLTRNSFLYFFITTTQAFAQSTRITPIAPENPTNISDMGELINRTVEIAMFFVAIVAVLYIIVSGFNYIMAGGDEKKASAARKGIQNADAAAIKVAHVAGDNGQGMDLGGGGDQHVGLGAGLATGL